MAVYIDFAVSATAFLRKAHKRDSVFSLDVQQKWSEMFAVMVALGFFVRVGDYYRMVVPHDPSIETIVEELIRLAETEDQDYFPHPERYLATVTRTRAKHLRRSLRKRLREMGEPVELTPAGREALASASVENDDAGLG